MSLCLILLCLIGLSPHLAQAQGPSGYWTTSPCDAQGNLISPQQSRDGFFLMGGTESGQASNTYPVPMVASLRANPGTFSGAASPLGVTTIPTITATAWVGIVGYPTYGSFASNELADGSFLYSVNPIYGSPSTGFINGSVSTKVSGQLVFYFKVQWQGGSSPTVPMPKSISLLLNTNLFATTHFFYGNSGLTSGLSAFSSASDGPPFNETASSTGPTSVIGYHLVQAAVAPLTATAGLTQVYLNGTVVQTASDPILAGAYDAVHGYHVTNGMTQASADSEVTAGVRPDSRNAAISCPSMDSPFVNNFANNYYKGAQDVLHGTDRYQHPRLPSGNSVDSVAYTLNDPLTGQQFIAGSTYNSGATGFISPTFVWSISGDGKPDASTLAYMSPSLTNPHGVVNLPANVKFGSTWNIATKKSNQFTVTITDSDQATTNDTYSVTWHAPQENFSLISYRKNVPKLVGLPQPITLNASVPSNLSIPGQEGEIDWGDVKQKSGLPVAVAGTAAGLLLLPEVAAGPPGWLIVGAQAVAAGASYSLGTSPADHPGTVQIQGNADYAEYLADLKHQVTTNNNPAYADNMISFQPTAMAAQAYAASSTDPSKWSTDPYFLGCTATWQGGWYTDIKDLDGEGYDVNGYTGHVPAHTEIPVALFKHFVWTCTYVKPPTN